VETDEVMMTEYLEGIIPNIDVLKKTLRKAVISNEIFPVFAGSALKNKGVQLVLDGVVDYLPAPTDIPPIPGINPDTEEPMVRHADDKEPFAALAFKVATDPFVGQIIFFRVYSGSLMSGSYVYNPRTRNKERIGRILRMHANDREEVKQVFAGEIAAAVGLKDTITSDTICDENNPIELNRIVFRNRSSSFALNRKQKPTRRRWVWRSTASPRKTLLLKFPLIKKQARQSSLVWENFIWKLSWTA